MDASEAEILIEILALDNVPSVALCWVAKLPNWQIFGERLLKNVENFQSISLNLADFVASLKFPRL